VRSILEAGESRHGAIRFTLLAEGAGNDAGRSLLEGGESRDEAIRFILPAEPPGDDAVRSALEASPRRIHPMAHRIDAGCAIHHVFDVGHVTDRTVHHRAAESTARASSVLREASL